MRRKGFRVIGDEHFPAIRQVYALVTDASGDHRDAIHHAGDDFALDPGAIPEGGDKDPRFLKKRQQIRDVSGYPHPLVLQGQDLRSRLAAGDRAGYLRQLLSDTGENLLDEPDHCVHVGLVVKTTKEKKALSPRKINVRLGDFWREFIKMKRNCKNVFVREVLFDEVFFMGAGSENNQGGKPGRDERCD